MKSAVERHAIFTVHGEKCYICGAPLILSTMTVDHVIPERLADTPDELSRVLIKLGRPADFDLNSYANLMPACSACNTRKSDTIWEPTPLVQLVLQNAQAKALRVAALASETLHQGAIAKALNTLDRADEEGRLTDKDLIALSHYQRKNREPEQVPTPLWLAPNIRILQLTTPVGFTEKALDLLRSREYVYAIVQAERAADGRYHDILLWVTKEFSELAVQHASLYVD
jgi:hypothetical protein